MKRAANILFLIGAILSIVTAVSLVVTSIILILVGVLPVFKDALMDIANRYAPEQAAADIEAALAIARVVMITYGVTFLVIAIFSSVSSVVAFKARNTDNKTMFILNIVFGVLGCVEVNVVGAIFALIKGDTIENAPAVEVIEPKE